MPLKHKGHILPRYIPVHGQKQYCDLIRKLSGADSKDEKVEERLSLPPRLDAPAQACLHEADDHPRGQGHDLHQAGLPGHRSPHQQAGGADK